MKICIAGFTSTNTVRKWQILNSTYELTDVMFVDSCFQDLQTITSPLSIKGHKSWIRKLETIPEEKFELGIVFTNHSRYNEYMNWFVNRNIPVLLWR